MSSGGSRRPNMKPGQSNKSGSSAFEKDSAYCVRNQIDQDLEKILMRGGASLYKGDETKNHVDSWYNETLEQWKSLIARRGIDVETLYESAGRQIPEKLRNIAREAQLRVVPLSQNGAMQRLHEDCVAALQEIAQTSQTEAVTMLSGYRTQITGLLGELNQAKQDAKQTETRCAELEAHWNKIKPNYDGYQKTIEELKMCRERLEIRCTELGADRDEVKSKYKDAQTTIEKSKNCREQLETRCTELDVDRDGIKAKYEDAQTTIEESKRRCAELEADRDEIKSKYESAQITIEESVQSLELSKTQCDEAMATRDEVISKYEEAKIAIGEAKMRDEHFEKRYNEMEAHRDEVKLKYEDGQITIEESKKQLELSEKRYKELKAGRELLEVRYKKMADAWKKVGAIMKGE